MFKLAAISNMAKQKGKKQHGGSQRWTTVGRRFRGWRLWLCAVLWAVSLGLSLSMDAYSHGAVSHGAVSHGAVQTPAQAVTQTVGQTVSQTVSPAPATHQQLDSADIYPENTPENTVVEAPLKLAQAVPTDLQADLRDHATADISKGITAYNGGRFADAIAHWQTALTQAAATTGNELTQAYVLSNIATAYQQLGQAEPAQAALTQSYSIIQAWPDHDQTYWEVSARVLNTQGQAQWQQGKTQQALTSWQQAQQHYTQAQSQAHAQGGTSPSTPGLILTQINQALALQELGFNVQSIRRLAQLEQQWATLPPNQQLGGAIALGQALRRVGEFEKAEALLLNSLALARSLNIPANEQMGEPIDAQTREQQRSQTAVEQRQLELELGHTYRSLAHRAIALGKTDQATTDAEQAVDHYTKAQGPTTNSEQATSLDATGTLLRAQAQLNQLTTLIEIGQLDEAQRFWPHISLNDLNNLPVGRASIEAYISYAHGLACLRSPTSTACVTQEWQAVLGEPHFSSSHDPLAHDLPAHNPPDSSLWESMLTSLKAAVQQAQVLEDPLLESYALGELGHAYELSGQWHEATQLTEQALERLEGRQMPEVAYRWDWQLGRIYRQQSVSQAIEAYQQALDSLAAVRQNLLLIDPQVQFSFRDNVEPIYREFVALLLNPISAGNRQPNQQSNPQPDPQPDQHSLKLAVKTLDALQLTELENFLGCDISQLVNLNEAEIDPNAIKIYPIILPDQLAIIFDIDGQPLAFRTVAVTQSEIEATIEALRDNLTHPGKTPAVLKGASQLYQWLIAPLEDTLAANAQIETMIFVPDGPLRNISMGVLYDGERYLIEKQYALAVAPQLDLFGPRRTPQQLKIIRGGVSLAQTVREQPFPTIEFMQAELNQIPEELTVAPPLLDELFTKSNIEQQLTTEDYSAIHWKTHGVFSSDPSETFLVAYHEGITANDLSELVQSANRRNDEPLELMVLSACATAQGDRRAVLGMAGIALRAGTRSILSTLWRADDSANTQLMATFYQGLNQGLTKAQALQHAQQSLMTEKGYPAPYYWAPYVLVGNWL